MQHLVLCMSRMWIQLLTVVGCMFLQPGPNNMTVGVATLLSRGQYPYAYWYWIGVAGLVVFIFLFNLGFTLALSYMPGKSSIGSTPSEWFEGTTNSSA